MKKLLTLVTSLVMMVSLASCTSNSSSEDAIYKAGTYEASAQGMGEVTVKVTVDDTSIKSIEADVSNETESIGQAAKDDIVNQIIEKQSTEIDGVTGATITTDAIKNAVNDALKQVGLIMDGDKVVGVKGEYYDGTTYEVYGKSVILATGGYIGNAKMCKKYTGYTWHIKAMTQCDGFAIREALELGGNLFNPDVAVEDHIAALDTIIRDSSVSVDDKALLTSLVTDTTYTMIDSNGELFDANYNGLGIDFNAWEAGSNYYVLINEEEYNSIKETGIANFVSNANGFLSQGGTVEVNTPIENFDDILALGEKWNDVVIADSLSDLSDKLGVDIKINDVHGATSGKVIAIKGAAYVYSTTGGVEVDTNINLVKEDGTPVENVYVVGNDSLGVLNESNKAYVTYGGCAQGWALTSGRLAGRNAAE